jgi:hypothetical protein
MSFSHGVRENHALRRFIRKSHRRCLNGGSSQATVPHLRLCAAARRLVERFEWHCAPKHGSWLDIAEPELASSRRDVSIRIPDKSLLIKVAA